MRYKRYGNKIIVRIDSGEEIVNILKQLCENLNIKLGTISGIGATNKATIGLYDVATRKYCSIELNGNHEITSLNGNISTMEGKPYLHLHANLCDKEYKSFGGHLNSAIVSATFEAVIEIINAEMNRVFDSKIGLNLLDI